MEATAHEAEHQIIPGWRDQNLGLTLFYSQSLAVTLLRLTMGQTLAHMFTSIILLGSPSKSMREGLFHPFPTNQKIES